MRTSSVDIEHRRFIYQEPDTKSVHSTIVSNTTRGDGLKNEDGAAVENENESTINVKKEASFPLYFSQSESESILQITSEIKNKLEFLLRGTSESQAVGVLADNLELTRTGNNQSSSPAKNTNAPSSTTNSGTTKTNRRSIKTPVEESKKVDNTAATLEDEGGEEEVKEPTVKVNHYKEMGLENTSIVKRIAAQIGM